MIWAPTSPKSYLLFKGVKLDSVSWNINESMNSFLALRFLIASFLVICTDGWPLQDLILKNVLVNLLVMRIPIISPIQIRFAFRHPIVKRNCPRLIDPGFGVSGGPKTIQAGVRRLLPFSLSSPPPLVDELIMPLSLFGCISWLLGFDAI